LIKQLKGDLKSDRASASSFLANSARLLLTAAAYLLHQPLRWLARQGTRLATVEPVTVMLTLFKLATRVKQYKDRLWMHLPRNCPVKTLLAGVCPRLYPSNKMPATSASP